MFVLSVYLFIIQELIMNDNRLSQADHWRASVPSIDNVIRYESLPPVNRSSHQFVSFDDEQRARQLNMATSNRQEQEEQTLARDLPTSLNYYDHVYARVRSKSIDYRATQVINHVTTLAYRASVLTVKSVSIQPETLESNTSDVEQRRTASNNRVNTIDDRHTRLIDVCSCFQRSTVSFRHLPSNLLSYDDEPSWNYSHSTMDSLIQRLIPTEDYLPEVGSLQ
jgi:hypothetical protein